VLTTDPGSVADFEAFARTTGNELILSEKELAHYRLIIRRAK